MTSLVLGKNDSVDGRMIRSAIISKQFSYAGDEKRRPALVSTSGFAIQRNPDSRVLIGCGDENFWRRGPKR